MSSPAMPIEFHSHVPDSGFVPGDAGKEFVSKQVPAQPANNALHRNSRCPRPFNVTFHLFLLVALHHCRHRLWVSLIR